MSKVFLLVLVLLLPFPADAAYKIYLKNGSAMSGVSSYERRDGELIIYFGGGSLGVPEKDVLKIEESGAPEKDFRREEAPGAAEEEVPAAPPAAEPNDKSYRTSVLRGQLDSINSEIKTVEENEQRLVKAINDRKGSRLSYNSLQLRQLENDLAPLRQELSDVQVRKGELLQQKATVESELRSLE
ncbi:MAG: hypothetical protein M1497_10050 [Nitrospirae bacterium]|nr:hypothetical protein [Nitrospirota bacterium]